MGTLADIHVDRIYRALLEVDYHHGIVLRLNDGYSLQGSWRKARERLQRLDEGALSDQWLTVASYDHLHVLVIHQEFIHYATLAMHCREAGLHQPRINRYGHAYAHTSQLGAAIRHARAMAAVQYLATNHVPGRRSVNYSQSWPL